MERDHILSYRVKSLPFEKTMEYLGFLKIVDFVKRWPTNTFIQPFSSEDH